MSTRSEKEQELSWLSRTTLQQLAKQHNIKANLKTLDLIQSLLDTFPCQLHSPECLLVLSTPSDTDGPSPPSSPIASHIPSSSPSPNSLSPTPLSASPFTSLPDDLFDPLPPFHSVSSRDLKARRKTWAKADIQIGDRLLSPLRDPNPPPARRQSIAVAASGGEAEGNGGMQVRTLMFSAVMEGDVEDTMMEETIDPVPTLPTVQVAPAAPHPPTRPPARTSTRLASAATRRQTMAPSSASPPWSLPPAPSTQLATAGVRRPLRPASSVGTLPGRTAANARPRFDVAASLAKPVSWRMHRGPITPAAPTSTPVANPRLSVENPNGRAHKSREGTGDGEKSRENNRRDSLQRRKQMRQRSVDYARTTRTLLGASTEGRAS